MIISEQSILGKVRSENQDYISSFKTGDFHFFVVADGMGGHNGGKVAGEECAKKVKELILKKSLSEDNLAAEMKRTVAETNCYIYDLAFKNPELKGMGTTLVFACISGGELFVENVGDSRLYIFRKEELRQITEDHSYVQQLVKMGEITPMEAEHHPDRNKITRAVGTGFSVESDSFREFLCEGDIVLLCTDGLTKMLSDARILYEIALCEDLKFLADKLAKAANDAGGSDNISIITVALNGVD